VKVALKRAQKEIKQQADRRGRKQKYRK